jgi:hypothetical protein
MAYDEWEHEYHLTPMQPMSGISFCIRSLPCWAGRWENCERLWASRSSIMNGIANITHDRDLPNFSRHNRHKNICNLASYAQMSRVCTELDSPHERDFGVVDVNVLYHSGAGKGNSIRSWPAQWLRSGWSCEPRNHIKSFDAGEEDVLPIKVSTERSSKEVWKTW